MKDGCIKKINILSLRFFESLISLLFFDKFFFLSMCYLFFREQSFNSSDNVVGVNPKIDNRKVCIFFYLHLTCLIFCHYSGVKKNFSESSVLSEISLLLRGVQDFQVGPPLSSSSPLSEASFTDILSSVREVSASSTNGSCVKICTDDEVLYQKNDAIFPALDTVQFINSSRLEGEADMRNTNSAAGCSLLFFLSIAFTAIFLDAKFYFVSEMATLFSKCVELYILSRAHSDFKKSIQTLLP